MWAHTLDMIGDHPVLGVGPGNWQFVYPTYDQGDMLKPGAAPVRPHNDLLWIAAETGLPGLAAFLWLLAAAALAAWRGIRRAGPPEQAVLTAAFACAGLAFLGHGLFSFPRERVETSFLFWFSLAVVVRLGGPSPVTRPGSSSSALSRLARYLMPAVLLLALTFTYRQSRFDRHYLMSRRYYAGSDYRSALAEAEQALADGPFDPQAFLMAGKGLQAAGRLQEAVQNNLEGLRYHPNSPELLGDLGTYYAMLDSLGQAESCFRRALELAPDHVGMYNNLGGVAYKRGDYERAIDYFHKAQGEGRVYTDATNNLGLAYVAAGRYGEAIEAFQLALERAPGDLALLHNLADARYRKAKAEGSSLVPALKTYEMFLRNWRGPASGAATARQRVRAIRQALASGAGG